jgi:hypothetical protein
MRKKKEYQNISAKMIQYHNEEVVPLVRKLKSYGPLKISRVRTLLLRDKLEDDEKNIKYVHDFSIEYILLNKFIIDLIPKEEINNCFDLLQSPDESNKIIASHLIYNLVEEKKKEIKEKLNETTI